MRGKLDSKIGPRRKGKKAASPPGGKAFLRLLAYLAQRDTALYDEAAQSLGGVRARRRGKRRAAPGKALATAMSKAATALAPSGRGRTTARARAAAPEGLLPPPTGWRFIGPNLIPKGQTYGTNRVDVIGRVASIAVNPKNPKHLLLGAAGGGIWRSLDAGATWAPCADSMPSLAIGAVAFDPRHPNLAYAGSGEGNFYANLGAGVYGSTDGGATWKVLASKPFLGVGFYDLVVDPAKPQTLFAATTAGFFRSTDSGVTWRLRRAGTCWDISLHHPTLGPSEILATFSDGLFASTNLGNSFTPVALPGAPAAAWARLAVDRVRNAPDVAYVFGAAGGTAHLWRRSGAAWTKFATPALSTNQAWYDWYVAAPPDNRGQVFLGAIDTHRGTFSGNAWTWKNITTQGSNSIHPDQHCLTFSPNNSKIIYAGNDGGIYRSLNGGGAWLPLNKGLGITELEFLAGNPNTWKWLMSGTQDNGTIRFKGAPTWEHVADGDGGDCGVNQLSPNIVYHSYYGVSLERSTNFGDMGTWTNVAPPTMPAMFYPPVEVAGSTVGIAGTSLDVTRTGIPPWTTFGLGLGSGEVSSAMRAQDANTFLIGTNLGRMLKVAWNGTAWTRSWLTSPAPRFISCVAVDPSNPSRIWVTISQTGGGLVYRSDDGGAHWKNCTPGLPAIPMNSVTVDPANYQRVWVAADVGVYQTLDLGKNWASFSSGLPNALAADLIFHRQDRVLVCGTRNRGAWAIRVP